MFAASIARTSKRRPSAYLGNALSRFDGEEQQNKARRILFCVTKMYRVVLVPLSNFDKLPFRWYFCFNMSPTTNPNFPCSRGECDRTDGLISVRLCNDIGETLLKAGAAGFFEASPCPMNVMTNLVNTDQTNEIVVKVKQNLGIKAVEGVEHDGLD